MSHPYSGVFDDTLQTPQSQIKGYSGVFDDTPEQKNQSFLNYAGDLVKHYFSHADYFDPAVQQNMVQGFGKAAVDMYHMFDRVITYSPDMAGVAHLGRDFGGTSIGTLPEIAKGLPMGMIKPVGDFLELISGETIGQDTPQPLTPEEVADRAKSSIALAASSVIAPGVSGALGKSILRNAAAGAITGATYGFIAGANSEDQMRQVLLNGIFAAPLGVVLGHTTGKKTNFEPSEVAQARALTDLNNSVAETLKTAQGLGDADNLAEALLNGKIGLQPNDVHIIPGISPAKLASLTSDLPEGYRSAVHVDNNGIGKLLAYDETIPNVDERFFEKYGVLKDQTVSYLGKEDWQVKGVTAKGLLQLENKIDGNKIEAHPNDIQSPSNITLENLQKQFSDRAYNEFKTFASKPQEEVASPNAQAYEPIGFDDTPPADFLDKHPENDNFNFKQQLEAFVKSKGLNPDQANQLKREIQLKAADEAYSKLEPEDQALLDEGRRIYRQDVRDGKTKVQDFNSLQNYAKLHGFTISEGGSGRYIIRDLTKTRKILTSADNVDDAIKWIDASGKPSGPKLDDNNHIDPNIASGGVSLPPEGPPKVPQDYAYDYALSPDQARKGNFGENFIRMLDNIPIITRYRNYFAEIDRIYNTTFLQEFDKVMEARNKRNFAAKPYAERLGAIKKKFNLTPKEQDLMRQRMETMSPQEVISNFKSEPLNPIEIGLARQIANKNVDLTQIFPYRREIEKIGEDYKPGARKQDPNVELAYQQQLAAAKEHYQIDSNHEDVVKLMDDIGSMPMDKVSLGSVVRLARAFNDGSGKAELSKVEFDKLHGTNPKVIAASNELAALYKDLAVKFGIPEAHQLSSYITHAKLYYNGDIAKAFKDFSNAKAPNEFFAALQRTGEMNAIETDPFKGALRYIKNGFDSNTQLGSSINNARAKINDASIRISDQGVAKQFIKVADWALNDAQGIPAAVDQASNDVVRRIFKTRYKILDDAINASWATAASSVMNAGALGFRVALGLWHLGTSLGISESTRDFKYTRRMLLAGGKMTKDGLAELQQKGVYSGISPFSIFNPDVDPTTIGGKVRSAINKAGDIAFKATLLPSIYDRLVAGHYTITYGDAIDALTKLARGEMTGAEVDKALFINRYDVAVARRFKQLATTNIQDAAHYLGRQAVEDLVGTYGSGNTPYMWGTKWGKLLGQYGNYPMWIRGTMQRMLSRGTWQDRSMSLAKLIAWHYTMKGLTQSTGIDFNKMDPTHPLFWLGGPTATIIEDAIQAIHGYGYQQKASSDRLLRLIGTDSHGNLHPGLFLPGSYAVDGLIQAADQMNRGNDVQAALLALGFRKAQAAKALGRGIP